jgi:tRNA modification GTPase
MPGPGSFTGEDVVEFHVHAGERNVRHVVVACLERGAKAAGPGDFSRRAFELGRLGLDEAEGIAALIGAQTDAELAQARRLAAGEVGRESEAVREMVEGLRCEVEANLDFPEDVAAADLERWADDVQKMVHEIGRWLARFEIGRRSRTRPRVCIAGPPNAGKSSLFNALLQRQRSLVSAEPGTTRDYVEARWELGPHACTLIDTAGLRAGAGAVEAQGIAFAQDEVAGADVVIWVEASDAEPGEVPAIETMVVKVESKRDLGMRRRNWVGVSATDRNGLEEVEGTVLQWFGAAEGEPWIGLERHRDRAREAKASLERAQRLIADGGALELVAFELDVAEQRLGEIVGRVRGGPVGEEVLALIFSRFCIGK